MTITIWGRRSSINVQKALWALEEVGVAYEQVDLGGRFGGLDTPEYRRLNPNGKVPTLRDGELVVWESHAIVRYLAARYGSGSLWPVDPAERATVDQWTDWTSATFQPAWIELFWLFVRTPVAQHDKQAIGKALAATYGTFSLLESRLSVAPFLAGSKFTYADIVAGVAVYRWMTMEIARPDLPALAAWYDRLQERSGFRQHVCVSYADMVGRLGF